MMRRAEEPLNEKADGIVGGGSSVREEEEENEEWAEARRGEELS